MIRLMFEFALAIWEDMLDPVKARRVNLQDGRAAVEGTRHETCGQPADGRFFAYRQTRNGVYPAIVSHESIGPPMEFVSEKHVLSPAEYGDSLATLVKRYPPPTIIISEE